MQALENYVKQEKLDGILYNMSPSGNFSHGKINGNIYFAIRKQLKDSRCEVSVENLDLYLSEEEYVIPDIMLFCDKNQIKNGKYKGVPKFVVETLSPATALRDKTTKLERYERLGIDEYWIISPKEKSVEIYHRLDQSYKLVNFYILEDDAEDPAYNADTVIQLKSVPIEISLSEIFENL